MIYSLLILIPLFFFERRKTCQKKAKTKAKLAWKLLCDGCASLVQFLREIITSYNFLARHRHSPQDFTRHRKLPFHTLIVFLVSLIKGSYQDELDNFFKALNGFDVAKRIVSKVALAKARMKLKYQAFIELNQHLAEYFYQNFKPIKWHDFNLLVVDGSTARLPRIAQIAEHFGVWHPRKGEQCPLARVSQLFDPLNKISVDAIISPKSIGERELAAQHFLKLLPEDLVLLDRGYPAFWLFKLILSLQSNFCARISCTKWKIIRKFYNSRKKEKIIYLPVSSASIRHCQDMGLDTQPLKLRLLRIELNTGDVEILITSLIDKDRYPYELFAELYHSRWPVEEDYKKMKCWIEVENFSGKSVLSVYQDFHAKVFSKNLTSALSYPTRDTLNKADNKKYQYQINFAQALSKTKAVIALLFKRPIETVGNLISDLHEIYIRTIEPIRAGRQFPRQHKVFRRAFYLNYKPVC